ncbi:MAG TPA: tyrosine-type recombinase/integrase [Candidatus Nanoarchaeia archaeon]|nr:tyrosine-type recombinase/integrase [Candidatus Nanoarchaeia archaeon]
MRLKRKRVKYPNVLNKEQLVKLFDTIDNPKVMVGSFIGFFCGLRIQEVCKLRKQDLDLVNRRLKVIDSKFGKDGYVPIPPQAIRIIQLWLEILGNSEWLFPSNQFKDQHISTKTLYHHFYQALERANLRDFDFNDVKGRPRYKYYFHTLRHSYATYLLEQGVPIEHISKSLRHEQLETTQIYAHISDIELQKRIDHAFTYPHMNNYQRISSNFSDVPKIEKEEKKIPDKMDFSKITDPIEILKLRFAHGEIPPEDFQKRMSLLKSNLNYIG